jgi:hypothetical protein
MESSLNIDLIQLVEAEEKTKRKEGTQLQTQQHETRISFEDKKQKFNEEPRNTNLQEEDKINCLFQTEKIKLNCKKLFRLLNLILIVLLKFYTTKPNITFLEYINYKKKWFVLTCADKEHLELEIYSLNDFSKETQLSRETLSKIHFVIISSVQNCFSFRVGPK